MHFCVRWWKFNFKDCIISWKSHDLTDKWAWHNPNKVCCARPWDGPNHLCSIIFNNGIKSLSSPQEKKSLTKSKAGRGIWVSMPDSLFSPCILTSSLRLDDLFFLDETIRSDSFPKCQNEFVCYFGREYSMKWVFCLLVLFFKMVFLGLVLFRCSLMMLYGSNKSARYSNLFCPFWDKKYEGRIQWPVLIWSNVDFLNILSNSLQNILLLALEAIWGQLFNF